MRFRRRVVLPEPRKPVTMVMGMGAMVLSVCTVVVCLYRVWIAVLR